MRAQVPEFVIFLRSKGLRAKFFTNIVYIYEKRTQLRVRFVADFVGIQSIAVNIVSHRTIFREKAKDQFGECLKFVLFLC